jgi:hypothetical protein
MDDPIILFKPEPWSEDKFRAGVEGLIEFFLEHEHTPFLLSAEKICAFLDVADNPAAMVIADVLVAACIEPEDYEMREFLGYDEPERGEPSP